MPNNGNGFCELRSRAARSLRRSFGLDQHWRNALVEQCLQLRMDDKVLDLATGTADVSILEGQHLQRLGAQNAVMGLDPSGEMLRRGVAKARESNRRAKSIVVRCNRMAWSTWCDW